jgi:hypothetical protein
MYGINGATNKIINKKVTVITLFAVLRKLRIYRSLLAHDRKLYYRHMEYGREKYSGKTFLYNEVKENNKSILF